MNPVKFGQLMNHLVRVKQQKPDLPDVFPRQDMAGGGRIGFYRGEKVVKSHGKQIKDLTEAGESSVSIAKKLKLKQQTVNAAMDAMDKGIAGEEFKLSKPRKDIVKLAVNQTGINLKDPKHLEEVIKYIDDNPNDNQKDAVKIFGRRKAELVDAKFYGSPGKKWSDEKAKLRNKARLELTKERSSPSLETELAAPKESGLNYHHAGFKKSLTDLKNTMYIPGRPNRQMAKLFEDPLLKEMEAFTKVFDDVDASPLEKQKAATNYLKNDRSLRKKYPQFKNFKTRLSFRRTALDPSGIMVKEKLPDPSLAISQEPGMRLKGETPSTPKGQQILEFGKNNLQKLAVIGCGFKAARTGGRIGFFEGQNLEKCALDGIKKLKKTDVKKLTPGDKANIKAITKTVQGGRLLKNILGPAALAFEGLFAAPFAAYDYARGRPGIDVAKSALSLGLLDEKLTTDELKKINPQYGISENLENIGDRLSDLERLQKGTRGQRIRSQGKTKIAEDQFKNTLEQLKKTDAFKKTGSLENAYFENIKKSQEAEQELQRQYDMRKQDRTTQFDLSNPFMAAGGGIAGLSGGDKSGRPPEKGPNSQGLPGLLKRGRRI